ncbi:unnamed protein product [Heligmosomoides polygyrus]|uniref:AT hook-like n=1 Tax=Heligmosomoides polygyrus TaxID=6339 RepID=A0A183GKY1_HELPZ|nr:unnamed protein product [Heligmosomoides polygyrus]
MAEQERGCQAQPGTARSKGRFRRPKKPPNEGDRSMTEDDGEIKARTLPPSHRMQRPARPGPGKKRRSSGKRTANSNATDRSRQRHLPDLLLNGRTTTALAGDDGAPNAASV